MQRIRCDQVNELFRDVIQDWTPSLERHHSRVMFAPMSHDIETSRRCSRVLSDVELKRAHKFLTEEHKNHFIQRRAFRRFCASNALERAQLTKINFEESDKGHPYILNAPDVSFSFASCRSGFIGAWSATRAVGIDIEDRAQGIETMELAERFFTDGETNMLRAVADPRRVQTFLRLWCLKESALKSIGEGLPYGLDAFAFDLASVPKLNKAPAEHGGPSRFEAYLIERNDVCAALVTHAKLPY